MNVSEKIEVIADRFEEQRKLADSYKAELATLQQKNVEYQNTIAQQNQTMQEISSAHSRNKPVNQSSSNVEPPSLLSDMFHRNVVQRPSSLDSLFPGSNSNNNNKSSLKRNSDMAFSSSLSNNIPPMQEKQPVAVNAARDEKDEQPPMKRGRYDNVDLEPSQMAIFDSLMNMKNVTIRGTGQNKFWDFCKPVYLTFYVPEYSIMSY